MTLDDSFFIRSRMESALDADKFMNYTKNQKIYRLRKLRKWITNSLENSMYPSEETKKLKDLRNDISNHLAALNGN